MISIGHPVSIIRRIDNRRHDAIDINILIPQLICHGFGQPQYRAFRCNVGSQLGNDNDILEQAMAGAPVAVLVDAGRLSFYQPEIVEI